MLLSASAFTANVLLIRALGQVQSVNIWLVCCSRFIVGLLLVSVVYRREFRPLHLFRNPKLVARGVSGGLGVCGFYLTIVHIGAGRATFINNTYIIFGALLAVVVLHERFRLALAIGGAAALAGLALLTNAFAAGYHTGFYDGIAILTAFTSAYVVVTIRQLHDSEHTSTIFASQCTYGLLICALPAMLGQVQAAPAIPLSHAAWTVMLTAAVVSAAGQISMTAAFRDLPVAEGSLIQMLMPLGVAVGGVVFFHEHFAPHELAGAALILAGIAFTALRR